MKKLLIVVGLLFLSAISGGFFNPPVYFPAPQSGWQSVNDALGTTTLNPSDKNSNITLSGGNLVATYNGSGVHGMVRATNGIPTSAKVYWEVTIAGINDGSTVDIMGVQDGVQSTANGNYVGFSGHGFGWGYANSLAQTYVVGQSSYVTVGVAIPAGTYGFAFDGTTGKLWVRNSSGWRSGNPTSGTSPSCTFNTLLTMFPAISFYTSTASATYNFGATAFTYSVP